MSNAPHTPGPWHVNDTEAHGEACSYAAVIIGAESVGSPCVASLEFGGTIETDSATTKANARLIATAPELLEACEQAEYWLAEELRNPGQAKPKAILKALRAVIAKARP